MLVWFGVIIAGIAVTVLVLIAGLRWLVKRSVPLLDGNIEVPGLTGPIQIRRDSNGMPTIEAATREEVAFGCGFAHAQERFFQMDVSRRIGSGELAALFGPKLVTVDRTLRVHQFRTRARRAVESLTDSERELLRAYTAGVNAGLSRLAARPFEYFLAFSKPRPWLEEDSLLVAYSLYIMLQDGRGDQKYNLQCLYSALPREVADFLAVAGDEQWDSPMIGHGIPLPEIPGPQIFTSADLNPLNREPQCEPPMKGFVNGSNCWVVSGNRTEHGGAMLANDLHLPFGMPNAFFRASFRFLKTQAEQQFLTGFTLPGYPLLVTGTNTKVVWGFSNSAADWVDLIAVGEDVETRTEIEEIQVRGGKTQQFPVRITSFGPIVRSGSNAQEFAMRWVAHFDGAVNLGLTQIEQAQSIDDVLRAAPSCGIPAQNIHAADADGDIAWTIAGRIPRRTSYSRLPLFSQNAGNWEGWLSWQEYPSIRNPPSGMLWSANARTVSGDDLEKLGYGFYIHGARAHQIRDKLASFDKAAEADFLGLQLDNRAIFLGRWRDLLLSVLDMRHSELKHIVENWLGRAAVECAGYRVVRAFRYAVKDLVFGPITEYVRKKHPDFEFDEIGDQWEAPLWRLVSERPSHLVPAGFADWNACLDAGIDAVIRCLSKNGAKASLPGWGELNQLKMRHPFSLVLPLVGRWLDMPPSPLNGDLNMPLSQIGVHGPILRMVVSPAREMRALGHLAGGQSSNPLSPYFGSGHDAWLHGQAAPLLAGPDRYELRLLPS